MIQPTQKLETAMPYTFECTNKNCNNLNSVILNIEWRWSEAVINTDSKVSLIKNFILTAGQQRRLSQSPVMIRNVQGTSVTNMGSIELTILLSDKIKIQHTFISVGDELQFKGNILLGLDFLKRFAVKVCLADRMLEIRQFKFPLVN